MDIKQILEQFDNFIGCQDCGCKEGQCEKDFEMQEPENKDLGKRLEYVKLKDNKYNKTLIRKAAIDKPEVKAKYMEDDEILPSEIYDIVVKELPAEDIDHHYSDLYIKKSPKSTELINRLKYKKGNVEVFRDEINKELWYELPFCFPQKNETVDTTKLFALEDQIAPIENRLMRITKEMEALDADDQRGLMLHNERKDLEAQLKKLNKRRDNVLEESAINEISDELADDVNTQRQLNSVKAVLKYKDTNKEEDRLKAKKAVDQATKNNQLYNRWKKADKNESKTSVYRFEENDNIHEIVRTPNNKYIIRYNVVEGKARTTRGGVQSLPTALDALKAKYPEAKEMK